MRTFELVVAILCGAILVGVTVAMIVAAISGRDIVALDRYHVINPRLYQRIRWICRFNCPLVALMCSLGMIASIFEAISPEGSLLAAVGGFVTALMFLWMSVRWFLWSIRTLQ